ncbi:hypothetical protein [Sphingopyxis indica]|uniref:hypothetical protein n=1 Tax=Sphingopyxis indica TaxID=436663 RepID=UPI000B76E7CD|nr:hypothetical protein [Sphingopyxis indica]
MKWTVFEYLYRDADNHKAYGKVALEGIVSDERWKAALSKLDEGIYFVAEQIGLPALCDQLFRWSGNAPTDADHCWHEFISISIVDEADLPTAIHRRGSTERLVERISAADVWNIWLSPNVTS